MGPRIIIFIITTSSRVHKYMAVNGLSQCDLGVGLGLGVDASYRG